MSDRRAPEALVLVQELANTLDIETGTDALAAPDGVVEFARAQGLGALGVTLGPRDRPALSELREALRAACVAHAGGAIPPEPLAALGGMLRHAPLVLGIDASGRAGLRPAEGLSGVAALTARIASSVATAGADGSWARLKACEAQDCQWVYYDRSPAGGSRWCTMAVCGSRAKMRAYRAKRRA